MLLWGYKDVAMFDIWSIEHFVTGMNLFFLSLSWHRLFKKPAESRHWFSIFGWVVAACYGWETLEHYLETGLWGGLVAYWFQGVEHWTNRLIADPLLILLGAWMGYRYRALNYPSKIFSVGWILIHVFVFPHSMYLQHFTPNIPL